MFAVIEVDDSKDLAADRVSVQGLVRNCAGRITRRLPTGDLEWGYADYGRRIVPAALETAAGEPRCEAFAFWLEGLIVFGRAWAGSWYLCLGSVV